MQADAYKEQIVRELEKVRQEVERQRMRINAFQDVYGGLVRKYLMELDEGEISGLYSRLDDMDKMITNLMEADLVPSPEKDTVASLNDFDRDED
jgi:hypothetical protein